MALALPFTAFITFILMGWQGVTANLMSLGGLALALGMVVDASIVVTENIARLLSERANQKVLKGTIVYEAIIEVARPIVFAILIIVVVLLPLFTLEQMEGKMFKPLATTMCFAMAGSLVAALTIVPVLCSLFLKGHTTTRDNFSIRVLKIVYLPVLSLALRFRWVTVTVAVTLFGGDPVPDPPVGHGVSAAARRRLARDQCRAPAIRLAGGVGGGRDSDGAALAQVPGGRNRGDEDRPRGDLRRSDGAGAERPGHHAAPGEGVEDGAHQGGTGRRHQGGSRGDPGRAAGRSRSPSRCASTS